MVSSEEILTFQNALTSARLLVELHGSSAWLVADKRSFDCFWHGYDDEGVTWEHVKIIINEIDAKAKLAPTQIH